jgi:hypothetical protein
MEKIITSASPIGTCCTAAQSIHQVDMNFRCGHLCNAFHDIDALMKLHTRATTLHTEQAGGVTHSVVKLVMALQLLGREPVKWLRPRILRGCQQVIRFHLNGMSLKNGAAR